MRGFLKPALTAAATVLLSLCFAVTSRSQSLPGYQAPVKPKPTDNVSVAAKAKSGEVPLRKLYGHLKADASKTIHLRALKETEKRQKSTKILQIGVVRALPRPLDLLTNSASYTVPEGHVRVASVVTEGALYTRVQFRRMSLPAGARLFIYSASNQDEYYGPYEGHGESADGTFWTPPIRGDSVVIEYFTPAEVNSTNSPFKISAIAHIYKDLTAPNDPAGACENDVTSDWLNVAKSVGRVDFISGPIAGSCTGTLLNDQANDQEPYFLTAHHCISTQTEAQSVTVYWNYNSGEDPTIFPSTNGAGLLATGAASDFTLLRLNKNQMPSGLFFSGWDATNFAGTAAATGIHHPQASHKRISFGTAVQPNPGDCDPDEQCVRVNWSSGVTEAGSSGSGIWTGSPSDPGGPKLVGNLTGGPSACDEVPANMWDTYGRFSVTYPVIAGFLTGNCVSFVNPLSQNFPGSGGNGSFSVTAPGGCNWIAGSTESFVTTTSTGTGSGTVNFSVAANPNGLPRSATIFAGTQTFNIHQAGNSSGNCAPTAINFGQTINGALTVNSCPLGDGSVLDAYSFSATASQQVSILMTSADFDTYLFLINPNGTILTFDDDGGGGPNGTNSRIPPGSGTFITLPTTGTYTILANAFWPADHTPEPGVGSYSLTLTERPTQTLTLASSNPETGITVTYTPNDRSGNGSAITTVTRTFYQNQSVNLNLSSVTAPNGNLFRKWQLDGVDYSTISAISVNTNVSHTATAVFSPPQNFALTVNSSNPGSGVDISATTDDGGGGIGTTPFTRTYAEAVPTTMITLNAPNTAPGGNVFQKWQIDGVDHNTGPSTIVFMNAAHTVTAVYVAPVVYTLTVNSSNPSTGVNIAVSPNDNNGSGDGVATFTRSYNQATHVFLTAPATAPNGNVFDHWTTPNGNSFSRSFDFFVDTNRTFTAFYATKPFVWLETGTTNAVAVNSVTFLRGPFQILDPHNFSADGHTRIILFTSDLGLTQADLSDPAVLVVTVQTLTFPTSGWTLPVEAVGPYSGGAGLTGSYIVVKLPDGLPTGQSPTGQLLELRVRLRQTTSDASFITIAP